jgi:hypothetical protein
MWDAADLPFKPAAGSHSSKRVPDVRGPSALGSIPASYRRWPILRVLCEGWDTQISPFHFPQQRRKADLFLLPNLLDRINSCE